MNFQDVSIVPFSLRRSRWFKLFSGLYNKPSSAVGTTVFLLFVIVAIFGPIIAPYQANEQLKDKERLPPSSDHLFGTDNLGRDVFSRVLLGAREILNLAGFGTIAAVILGTIIGLISGYKGGLFDELWMRLFDSLLAIPALLLSLLLLGTLGPTRNSVLIVIVIVYSPIVSRVIRSVVLSVKTQSYVEASLIQGESTTAILYKDILPAALPALSVETALRFSYAIFLVASLGFLGVGIQPPSPDWGLMVKEARGYVGQIPWAMYFPAGAIALVVICVNLMADGIKRVSQEIYAR